MAWTTANQITDGGVNGFHILLFVLLVFYSFHLVPKFPESSVPDRSENLFVQIDGGIRYPGVYPCSSQAALKELIDRGGGLKNGDDIPENFENIVFNESAGILLQKDGGNWKLSHTDISAFYKYTLGLPISINNESAEGLSAIPGVGPGLADNIVKERERRGGFKHLEELMDVHGIGDKKYRKISQFVSL
ncbi:helix-hairpin-helix domain-containing protein [Thermodesulfobacteriota bacterium]